MRESGFCIQIGQGIVIRDIGQIQIDVFLNIRGVLLFELKEKMRHRIGTGEHKKPSSRA
jgi:hypothetical protein